MKFSIIIPLYNKENHIKRAIESVLQQTYREFELIIVDDGSTDSSYNIAVNSSSDSRMKIFRKKNGGVSSARNFGIEHASHDYIGFLDADDEWKPSFLESIYKLINIYPEAGAYATSYEFKKGENTKRADINVTLEDGESGVVNYFKDSLNGHLITASSVVIKKQVFNDVGLFSTKLSRGEDTEMWCRIALRHQIVFLNKVLATYYQDTENKLTQKKVDKSESFTNYLEVFLEEQRNLNRHSIYFPYFEEYIISRLMFKIRYLISIGQNKEARKILLKYKYTKHFKKQWIKNYILSIGPVFSCYQKYLKLIKNQKSKNQNY